MGSDLFFPTLGQAVDAYLDMSGVEWVDWEDERKQKDDGKKKDAGKSQAIEVENFLPSSLHSALISLRAEFTPVGSPPPGSTHCPHM